MPQSANIALNVVETVTLVKIPEITVGSKTASLARLITITHSRDGVDVVVNEQVDILWGETVNSVEANLRSEKAKLTEEVAIVDGKIAYVQAIKDDIAVEEVKP